MMSLLTSRTLARTIEVAYSVALDAKPNKKPNKCKCAPPTDTEHYIVANVGSRKGPSSTHANVAVSGTSARSIGSILSSTSHAKPQ